MKESSGMTIKDLAAKLQKQIDSTMAHFMHENAKLKAIAIEIEEIEKKMYVMVQDLEPVESLVYNQNPQVERIFETLKKLYGKGNDGIDREAD